MPTDDDEGGCFKTMSDSDLVREMQFLADRARHNEIRMLHMIGEFDARRLFIRAGFRSMFEYCTNSLAFDEYEAFRRIKGARVFKKYPEAARAVERRKISISAVVVLAPFLTSDNVSSWLKKAEGRSRRELEASLAVEFPQAPMPDAIRHLPTRAIFVSQPVPQAQDGNALPGGPDAGVAASGESAMVGSLVPVPTEPSAELEWPANGSDAPSRLERGWQVLAVVAIDRVRVGFDAAAALARLIERARQILRHKYPEGRLEDVFRDALETLLDRKDPQRRFALKTAAPAAVSEGSEPSRLPEKFLRAWAAGRYIPAKIKSAVWQRDGGRCSWREADGTVCGCQDRLEYDHIRPFAKGGRSDDPRNIRLLCGAHNQAAARAAGFTFSPPPAV